MAPIPAPQDFVIDLLYEMVGEARYTPGRARSMEEYRAVA
jgi:hypothetical protein